MARRIGLFVAAAVWVWAASPARAQTPVQNPVTSTYTYYWTLASDPTNTPITSADVASGQALNLRFWLREAAGGNALSANAALGNGLGAFDMRLTWSVPTALQIPTGAGAGTAVNTNVSPNPYSGTTSPPGFFTGGFRNNQTATANTAGTAAFSHSSSPSDSAQWATTGSAFNSSVVGAGGNFVGSDGSNNVLLTQVQFAGATAGLVDVTGGQNTTGNNYAYAIQDVAGTPTPLFLDSLIGSQSATVHVTVTQPVPEPATVLGVCAAGLGLAGWVRRRKLAVAK
jgi:hypothetical protein